MLPRPRAFYRTRQRLSKVMNRGDKLASLVLSTGCNKLNLLFEILYDRQAQADCEKGAC